MKAALIAVLALSAVALTLGQTCPDQSCQAASTGWDRNETPAKNHVCAAGSWRWDNTTAMSTWSWCRTDVKKIGDACTLADSFCGPFMACRSTDPATPGSETRKCYGTRRIGDSCSTADDCERPRPCTNGKCAASVATGASCLQAGGLNPVCPLSDFCKYSGATAVCTARAAEGASCGGAEGTQCLNSLSCVGPTSSTMKCVKPLSQPLQTMVDDFSACESFYANTTGYCAVRPDISALVGATCTMGGSECGTSGLLGCACTGDALTGNSFKCRSTDSNVPESLKNQYSTVNSGECERITPGLSGGCLPAGAKSAYCTYYKAVTPAGPPCSMDTTVTDWCNSAFSRMSVSLFAIAALVATAFGAQW